MDGAHYTPEPDVLRALEPALLRPLRERLAACDTEGDRRALHELLSSLRVLDPACGAGDFLRVALRELRAVERALLERLDAAPRVGPWQVLGIDIDPEAARKARAAIGHDDAITCADALFCDWPRADVIVGNPPFLAKNKLQAELGAAYARRLRDRYPEVPGRADYCVYWFHRAHDELPPGGRAALVGTNTIRENDSRRGGLEHIVRSGGTILEAVASQVWPGRAVVHVSVVSWVKGPAPGKKRILTQVGHRRDGPFRVEIVDHIPPTLAAAPDAAAARVIHASPEARVCFQGLTPGHAGFLIHPDEARAIIAAEPHSRAVLHPFLTGEDLLTGGAPSRFVADLSHLDLPAACAHRTLFARIEAEVRPAREAAARREQARRADLGARCPGARSNAHHAAFLQRFWGLAYPRHELCAALAALPRYIACSRVARRPIFAQVDARVRPSDALAVFALPDSFSFGVLQSDLHAAWLRARGSTMKGDLRYTSSTVFDTFPWPERPSTADVAAVADAADALSEARRALAGPGGLRALYAEAERAPGHPLSAAHARLDEAVRAAYGIGREEEALGFLLALNARQAEGDAPRPGLPKV